MSRRLHALAWKVTALGGLLAGAAFAQPSNQIWAEKLFEEGRQLMEAGNYDDGCPKLAESHSLDPAGGTVLNLAICYEKAGKTASAWATYKEALAFARKDEHEGREKYATEKIVALQPALSHFTLTVADDADVPGMAVELDGRQVPRAAWGTRMPIDPGSHELVVSAPDRTAWSRRMDVGPNGDHQRVEVPRWQDASPPPPPVPKAQPTDSTPDLHQERSGSNQTTGYLIGAGGLALIGVGTYFGIRAFSTWDERNDHCPEGKCDAAAVQLAEDANQQGHISNVAVGLGVVAVGIGAYLTLFDSEDASAVRHVRLAPEVFADRPGVSVGGAF